MKYLLLLFTLNVFAWLFGDMLPDYIQFPMAVVLFVGAVVVMVVGIWKNDGYSSYLSQEIARKPQPQPRQIEKKGAEPLSEVYFVNIDEEECLIFGKDLKEVLVAMADVKIQFRQQKREQPQATRYAVVDGQKQLEARR
jgi:hypothetical protein